MKGRYHVAGPAAAGAGRGEGAMEKSFTRRSDEPQPQQLSPFTEGVRRVLRTELLKDTCSVAAIACLFSMHRRTLHRHLQTEGVAFRQVANEIRFEIACDLLANTEMTLSQIAAALRYSEPSAFTRAFRRWSGQTPSAWRRDHVDARRIGRRAMRSRLGQPPNSGGSNARLSNPAEPETRPGRHDPSA
jgi:AraC-like DNA-binding protein